MSSSKPGQSNVDAVPKGKGKKAEITRPRKSLDSLKIEIDLGTPQPSRPPTPDVTTAPPAAPKARFVPRTRNPVASAAAYVGRKLAPSTLSVDFPDSFMNVKWEPGLRIDSKGLHQPGSNYTTLENRNIDYEDYKYKPVMYDLRRGGVHKGRTYLGTAFEYGVDKLAHREARKGRLPVPMTLRKAAEMVVRGAGNLAKGRLAQPVPPIPTSAQADGILANRTQLAARIDHLFAAGTPAGADPTTHAPVRNLLDAMNRAMGQEDYPVPAFQKQAFMAEALAIASGGNIADATAAIGHIAAGLDPHPPAADGPGAQTVEAAWRAAQILAVAGGDGFDTLLKAGAVRRADNSASGPREDDPRMRRKQQALRIYLEASAQITESVRGGNARPSQIAVGHDTGMLSSTLRAALKLYANPDAGRNAVGSPVPPAQRLTRAEKNHYYAWSQGFGKAGTRGMLAKAKERMHKFATTWMDRAQARGFGEGPSRSALNPTRVLGMQKSPLTGLAFGTRGSHLRYPSEVRTQYDAIVRPIVRELQRHFEAKVATSTDFNSLARNLIDREFMNHWGAKAMERDGDEFARRPLEGEFTKHDLRIVLARVQTILAAPLPAEKDPLAPNLRALVTNPAQVNALQIDGPKSGRFDLDRLADLVTKEGIGGRNIPEGTLKEVGLHAANRKNLPAEMTKERLFGNDGTRPATLQSFVDRAKHIRDTVDELKPSMGADGSVITGLKEFNDTYVRIEPMGPRVRAQDGGVVGINNVGAVLNMLNVAVAPDPRVSRDHRAYFEYNSGGHAFEIAFGKQTGSAVGAGAGAGVGNLEPDGTAWSASGMLGFGIDWLNQEGVRLRGRRELNDAGEALHVVDDPMGVNHGRVVEPAKDAAGNRLMADLDGRRARVDDVPGGGKRFTYLDDNSVVIKDAGGRHADADGVPVNKEFSPAWDFKDDGSAADGHARMDKPRYHLMQATDFLFVQAQQHRTLGDVTPDTLWNDFVDQFFENPDVSLSYQHHKNFGTSGTVSLGAVARKVTGKSRVGGGGGAGYTERPYEALNRSDQTGTINRTIVQVGHSGFASVSGSVSASFKGVSVKDTQAHSDIQAGTQVDTVGLPSFKLGNVNMTLADQGVLTAFRTVETDGKIVPEFTYMDIEYRNIDLYKEYVGKNRAVWEAFYGGENLDKHLEKLSRDAEPNQRFSERWRLSPEGAHQLRSYMTMAKIHHGASRRANAAGAAELERIQAKAMAQFAAEMLENRNMWDPLGAYVVEVNSKERSVGPNLVVQAQQVTRSVSDAELDWIGGSSAGMNNADRLRHDRAEARKTVSDWLAGGGLPQITTDPVGLAIDPAAAGTSTT